MREHKKKAHDKMIQDWNLSNDDFAYLLNCSVRTVERYRNHLRAEYPHLDDCRKRNGHYLRK